MDISAFFFPEVTISRAYSIPSPITNTSTSGASECFCDGRKVIGQADDYSVDSDFRIADNTQRVSAPRRRCISRASASSVVAGNVKR
jgi:hypothetical protein